mgnify:CR=1 FL=1
MHAQIAEADLLEKLAAAIQAAGGTIISRDVHAVNATLTAIKSKWLLGGRKVTDSVTCRLVPETQEVHLRETAVETSWGLPPPTLTVETTVQTGSRVTATRADKAVGGGGRMEFGRFRDTVAQATQDAGWAFVYDVP